MRLQHSWFKSDDISELATALAEFQADAPEIPRNKTVKVKTKNGGTYSFDYAPLDVVFDSIRERLSEEGLSVTQLVGDGVSVTTVLMHESGQYIGATFDFKDNVAYNEEQHNNPFKDMQDVGSAVTYAKRYGLEAILGIVAQDDDDANKASGNSIQSSRSKSKKKSKNNKKSKSKSKKKSDGNVSYEELKELYEELSEDEYMEKALEADPEEVIEGAKEDEPEDNDFLIMYFQAHNDADESGDFKDQYQKDFLDLI